MYKIKRLLSYLLLLFIAACSKGKEEKSTSYNVTANNDAVFRINIDRKVSGNGCTQGYILVNDEVISYSLELPDLDNINYISSIPKGTYSAKIRTDGSKGWRIELENVPNRKNIQIHVGNYTRQILGCILIGTKVSLENCTVTNNYKHEAMKNLQNKFNQFTENLKLGESPASPVMIEVKISGI
ncbi:hypothetical protein C8N40_110135 [Pontibacter mucosus]|uniref:DUF5675 domain-containing protein n=1 Tax=Pontibacter mucosus TaxID=1649266 RepID=A0A2T5YDT6_9BACT|nr:DUF5675 family protein [Pontibacter mucosus]PTX14706.1 hypothetical protein C8N40_110135 [Pontibacter mucosus]